MARSSAARRSSASSPMKLPSPGSSAPSPSNRMKSGPSSAPVSESDFDSLAILKDKLAHEWRQRLEQALAARFDQVECLLVVARRASIGIGDVDGAACGAEAGEHQQP